MPEGCPPGVTTLCPETSLIEKLPILMLNEASFQVYSGFLPEIDPESS